MTTSFFITGVCIPGNFFSSFERRENILFLFLIRDLSFYCSKPIDASISPILKLKPSILEISFSFLPPTTASLVS